MESSMNAWNRVLCFFGATGALVLVAAVCATAQVERANLSEGPCKDDFARFCADAKGKRGAVAECLQAKVNEVDAGCREELEARASRLRERVAFAREACPEDIKRVCSDVSDRDLIPCLRKNHASLETDCQTVIPSPTG